MKQNQLWNRAAVLIIGVALVYSCSDNPKKEIVCWGDSLTSPHSGKNIKGSFKRMFKWNLSYPEYLAQKLGSEYEIVNAGVGGETSLTIMARQGAYPMKLAHDVVIFKSDEVKYETFIGNNDINAFVSSYNGREITPILQCGWDEDSPAQVNPCMINGNSFILYSESKIWREEGKFKSEYNYFIRPNENRNSTDTIKKGSVVITNAMENLRNKYANVFFVGQNGGFDDVADLIKQLKAMIVYSNSKRYIVISFHRTNTSINSISRMKEMEDSLQHSFGKHFINLRAYLVKSGLEDAGLKPTQEDRDSIAKGQVPPQLMTDGCHFTSVGYKEIAALVFNKMKELGY